MEREKVIVGEYLIAEILQKRAITMKSKEQAQKLLTQSTVERALKAIKKTEVNSEEVKRMLVWLEKIAKFVPISSEKELEELVKIMNLLGIKRSELHELYDKPGLNLMKRVREGMIRFLVVLNESRSQQGEILPHWFMDDHWLGEWSRVILDLSPSDRMVKYGFPDIEAKDFLFLLELELACADSASKLEKPMIKLQSVENKDSFLIIPTQNAAEEYSLQVDRIKRGETTFKQWVQDTLTSLKLP